MCRVIFILFSPDKQRVGGGSAARRLFCSLFRLQQTTSGIVYRVKQFFRVGDQYPEECEKQQDYIVFVFSAFMVSLHGD